MFFLLMGLAAILLKYLEWSPFATLSWWLTLIPFGLAVAWWSFADASGYTKRREVDKMDKRKEDRLNKQRSALGMLPKKRK
jgi:small Trp-rich protein